MKEGIGKPLLKTTPQEPIARGTGFRFLEELKRKLKS